MKGIFVVLLLLTVVKGGLFWENFHNKWPFQPPGHMYLPPGQSFQPPGPPFPFPGLGHGRFRNWYSQQQQNDLDVSNAEWICQNPKTRDMMIIAPVEGSQTVINGQVLPTTQSTLNCKKYCQDMTTPVPNTSTQVSDSAKTGEGAIDVRLG